MAATASIAGRVLLDRHRQPAEERAAGDLAQRIGLGVREWTVARTSEGSPRLIQAA